MLTLNIQRTPLKGFRNVVLKIDKLRCVVSQLVSLYHILFDFFYQSNNSKNENFNIIYHNYDFIIKYFCKSSI